ncbi:hypothetical protein DYB25_002826 [Aphanomyces astaci]|uniref:EF-hand domain-containing protein n=1 Tax=Aphanomyces astaci TaxID=112090 RepID=A0A397E780_APHAT|nr:hypothetical protein DYB25_002826 [Aphanomyces astaci]RHY74246.1 hypothetical protein DYB30_003894 [Aphanomyces astaci]
MGVFRDIVDAHERLKKRIHSTRIPLGPKGKAVMTAVYFTTPIVCGYFVMQWAQSKAEVNLKDVTLTTRNPSSFQNDSIKQLLKDIHNEDEASNGGVPPSSSIFETKSGYRDEATQAKLLEKHFRYFDTDGSGVIDYHEFTSAMLRLNFVGVQAELEGLFDRYDEDLNGTLSYVEFASVIFGTNGVSKPSSHVKSIEFYNGLLELGVQANEIETTELDKVFCHFDRDGNGRITIHELLRGLRVPKISKTGGMGKRRILLVRQAFDLLDESKDGTVTVDEIASRFDTSHHPDILSGRLKPVDVLRQFLAVFEGQSDTNGVVTWHEFLNYYRDLGAGIENDDEFELIVRNAWHMSGGEGWCENSTCRRVLVTHSDGSQRVCEIQNDLGIGPKDKTKMVRQLLLQGVRDIVDVKLAM